jgi:hypothetical protein
MIDLSAGFVDLFPRPTIKVEDTQAGQGDGGSHG